MMYVYVISAGAMAQKIGLSAKAAVRLSALQVAHHTTLTLIHMTLVDDARAVEHYAHLLLAEHKLRGEWFEVTPDAARTAVEVARKAVDRGELYPQGRAPAALEPATGIVERFTPDDPDFYGTVTIKDAERRRDLNAEMYRRLVGPRREPAD